MLDSRVLLDGPVLRVARVFCSGHERRFGPVEPVTTATIVLPCRGVFRLRVNGRERVVDPASAYLQWPGDEEQFAHPAGGDVCTAIALGPGPAARLADAGPAHRAAPVAPSLALAHRRLLSRARSGADRVELTDLTADLVAEVLTALAVPAAGAPARRRILVEDARELLSCEPDRALPDLAARLGTSPWWLSRMFHQVTGVTLHRYRTRLRVSAALDRLGEGVDSLAGLATELGFADQAHLSRVVRQCTGLPPGRLRALLGPARPSPRNSADLRAAGRENAPVPQATLQTSRILLVPLSDDHLEYEVELDSDPEVMRYLGDGRPRTREEVTDLHRRRLAIADRAAGLGFWAGLVGGEFVGWWILEPPERPDQGPAEGQAELGYRLLRRHWRQGLASEGARELIRHGFEDLGLKRIFAETMAVNTASRATMSSVGLAHVRTFHLDWDVRLPGSELGEVEYAITLDEWLAGSR